MSAGSTPRCGCCARRRRCSWSKHRTIFLRTAAADYQTHGRTIRKGDAVMLCFRSANRDEAAFDDPFRFDVGRTPNRHLAFGHGPHTCIGAALAQIEVEAFWSELLPRLEFVEFRGTPKLVASTFVGGLKSLPLRSRISR